MIDIGYAIMADYTVMAICVGTQAEADAVCLRLKTEKDNAIRHQYGELAEHLLPDVYWVVHKVPILLK